MGIDEADGVFQGGGMKGIAIGGALDAFAHHPRAKVTRWVNVAGTSAGGIIASALACGFQVDRLSELMLKAPYPCFEDFGPGGRVFGGAYNLMRHHGYARGKYFRDWLDDTLDHQTFAAVRNDGPRDDLVGDPYRLRLIAADITQGRLLVLPTDLAQYCWPGTHDPINPDEFKIADAARMSMSIPYFFQPIRLRPCNPPTTDPPQPKPPKLATIVDGGILSNFPVWLFDVDTRPPVRPTFGFRLTGGRGVAGGVGKLIRLLGWPAAMGTNMLHTTTEAWDERFMSHSTVVRTCNVDAHDARTTNFGMKEPARLALAAAGRKSAATFLDGFHLDEYMNTFGRRLTESAVAQEGSR